MFANNYWKEKLIYKSKRKKKVSRPWNYWTLWTWWKWPGSDVPPLPLPQGMAPTQHNILEIHHSELRKSIQYLQSCQWLSLRITEGSSQASVWSAYWYPHTRLTEYSGCQVHRRGSSTWLLLPDLWFSSCTKFLYRRIKNLSLAYKQHCYFIIHHWWQSGVALTYSKEQ